MRYSKWICFSVAILIMGCTHPAAPYNLDTPPLLLAPATTVGVQDGRGRFREIYCAVQEDHGKSLPDDKACKDVVLRLGNEPPPTGKPVESQKPAKRENVQIIVVPGVLSECIAKSVSTYSDAIPHLNSHGYKATLLQVSGRGSTEFNAKRIWEYISEVAKTAPKDRFIFIGYSKGVPDILEALIAHPELQNKTLAVVSIAGAVGGSPMIDALTWPIKTIMNRLPFSSCPPEDEGALKSLTPSIRMKWLVDHPLTDEVQFFSLAAFDSRDGISTILRSSYDILSEIDPRNDGQLIFYDAIIPGSVLLGYVKADHWAVSMPFSRQDLPLTKSLVNHNAFPREVLLESIVRFVEESISEGMCSSPDYKTLETAVSALLTASDIRGATMDTLPRLIKDCRKTASAGSADDMATFSRLLKILITRLDGVIKPYLLSSPASTAHSKHADDELLKLMTVRQFLSTELLLADKFKGNTISELDKY